MPFLEDVLSFSCKSVFIACVLLLTIMLTVLSLSAKGHWVHDDFFSWHWCCCSL